MPRQRHTARARRDLLDIWLHIAAENPAAADRVYDRLEMRVRVLERFPELGPLRPDIAATAGMLVESPYLILYRIHPDAVQIVPVVRGERRIDNELFSEGLE